MIRFLLGVFGVDSSEPHSADGTWQAGSISVLPLAHEIIPAKRWPSQATESVQLADAMKWDAVRLTGVRRAGSRLLRILLKQVIVFTQRSER